MIFLSIEYNLSFFCGIKSILKPNYSSKQKNAHRIQMKIIWRVRAENQPTLAQLEHLPFCNWNKEAEVTNDVQQWLQLVKTCEIITYHRFSILLFWDPKTFHIFSLSWKRCIVFRFFFTRPFWVKVPTD